MPFLSEPFSLSILLILEEFYEPFWDILWGFSTAMMLLSRKYCMFHLIIYIMRKYETFETIWKYLFNILNRGITLKSKRKSCETVSLSSIECMVGGGFPSILLGEYQLYIFPRLRWKWREESAQGPSMAPIQKCPSVVPMAPLKVPQVSVWVLYRSAPVWSLWPLWKCPRPQYGSYSKVPQCGPYVSFKSTPVWLL